MASNCMWCGHDEDAHSAIFGECLTVIVDEDSADGISGCLCKEYAAARPDRPLREQISLTATAVAWWVVGLFFPAFDDEPRTIRARIRYLEEHTR